MKAKAKRGFAAMDPEKQRAIAVMGGLAGDPKKKGFAGMTPEKQRAIASKGGFASHGGGRPKSEK